MKSKVKKPKVDFYREANSVAESETMLETFLEKIQGFRQEVRGSSCDDISLIIKRLDEAEFPCQWGIKYTHELQVKCAEAAMSGKSNVKPFEIVGGYGFVWAVMQVIEAIDGLMEDEAA